jgi:hypothetical protein
VGWGETADPSTTLRSGRDEKGGEVAQVGVVSGKGETAGPSTTLRSGRDDNSVAEVGHCSVASIPATTELSSRPERSVVEGSAVRPAACSNTFPARVPEQRIPRSNPTPDPVSQCRVATLVCPTKSTPQNRPTWTALHSSEPAFTLCSCPKSNYDPMPFLHFGNCHCIFLF